MKPYASYKPSGVSWLGGDIPSQWLSKRIKHVTAMRSGEGITAEAIDESGTYPVYGGNGIRGFTVEKTHSGEFVLVGRQGALCGNVHYVVGDFWASEHAVVSTLYAGDNPRWATYMLEFMNLGQYSLAAAQPGLAVDTIQQLKLPVPPPDEQQVITDYLDVETVRIDTLIHEKDELIGLLKEARASVIDRAVQPRQTKAAPLKRYVKGIATGPFGSALHSEDYVSGGAFLINPTHIVLGKLAPDADVSLSNETARALSVYRFKAGDIVVGRRGEMGRCAVVPDDGEAYYCGTGCLMLFPDTSKVVPSYLAMVISSTPSKDWLSLESVGSTMENLNSEILARLPCFIPCIDEQIFLLEQIQTEIAAFDNLLTYVHDEITLLKELRAATIADAVLGRVDVRTAPKQ
ncbi:restriction endonuclease subunit S [Polaromonas eurypsychrophila]|uniref:Restriction endonuclease S n=1 Tax=Polaromonas eurypsychrophila TaxID=1614635 RepID=A0A916SN15_9BURK|nr:restriction endonuclease subunit S [Polaromonas eurypsychrophila]GGB07147.1 restriction endonuclease S [Polaromonas eurypsychrophila]